MSVLNSSGLSTIISYIKSYVNNQISTYFSTGVAAKANADASGNVISTTYATKTYADTAASNAVSNVTSGANFIKSAAVNGNTLTLTKGNNNTVTFTKPSNTSDLTNDSGFISEVSWNDIASRPSAFTPTTHNHASNSINLMTGYSKPNSTSSIGSTDTLNQAIGKLEKALDGKQAIGTSAGLTVYHGNSSSVSITLPKAGLYMIYVAGYKSGSADNTRFLPACLVDTTIPAAFKFDYGSNQPKININSQAVSSSRVFTCTIDSSQLSNPTLYIYYQYIGTGAVTS